MIETVRSVVLYTFCMCVYILAACGSDSPTEPAVQVPARIDVTPRSITFESVGQTLTLVAKVIDTNQNEITGAALEWTTSDPMVVTVTQGLLVATGYGTAQITARYRTVSRTVNVTVKL